MVWSVRCDGIIEESFEKLGICDLSRRTLNQGIDSVKFRAVVPDINADHLFKAESELTILYDGKPWFHGILTKLPTIGSSFSEENGYELSGPWWYLEHLIFQQKWQYLKGKGVKYDVEKGRVVLGQDDKGMPITAAEQIKTILNYAIGENAPFVIGDIKGLDFKFIFDEIKDISCAEAIQRVLRWAPDAVIWFDYSKELPVLNIARRSLLKAKEFSVNDLSKLKILPRHDLKINSVVLKYESTNSDSRSTWKTLFVDRYPLEASGREYKSLVMTVEWAGSHFNLHKQKVKTEPILTEQLSWWSKHLPWLKMVDKNSFKISGISRDTDLPNELVGGCISKWMKCDAKKEIIHAKVSYETALESVSERAISVSIVSTDAVDKVYEKVALYKEPQPIPEGLAKKFYDSVSFLQYDGFVEFPTKEVVELRNSVGYVINLKDGRAEWCNMNALVQEVNEDVDSGKIKIRFGPAKQLGPDDLIQLMRSNRYRNEAKSSCVRHNVKASEKEVTELPDHVPLANSNWGESSYKKLIFGGNSKGRLVLDSASVPDKETVQLREYNIVDSGVLKKALILSS